MPVAEIEIAKHVAHVGVRFYRLGGLELALVPLLEESARFTRSAGDGYFLVTLLGEPGSAYPLNLGHPASFDPGIPGKEIPPRQPGLRIHP
jgi:hypothetical protein